MTPRGWTKGSTWDSADGFHDPIKKIVGNCENKIWEGKKGFTKVDRPEYVFKHETGHAVDNVFGEISKTDGFINSRYKWTLLRQL